MVKWSGAVDNLSFRQLIGESQLAITIEPHEGSRYQGIVPITKETLGDCLEHYFLQSEQLPTLIRLVANETTAAGFLLQKLPGREETSQQEDWEHVSILAGSVTNQEMLTLDFETLLYRLFHEELVRLFEPKPVAFECVCSKERCESAIASLGKDEIAHLIEGGKPLTMNCEFCGVAYRLDQGDLQ
jgi:molecular chaperone Hsp33